MTHDLYTEVFIEAGRTQVWDALTDFARYPEWNPFIVSAQGAATPGARLRLRMEPPGGRPMTFRPKVTVVSPGEALEWLGHLGLPGFFDGRHRFELRDVDHGTLVVQRESFRGLLVRPLRRTIDGATRAGFEVMNRALRDRVLATAQPV